MNNQNLKLNKTIGVGGIILILVVIFSILNIKKDNQQTASTNLNLEATELGLPTIQISETEIELGEMSVTEERSAEFTITNIGGKPLAISSVKTSCMCAFAAIIIDGKKSPEFNMEMHNSFLAKSWKGKIEPNKSAMVRVIYKPFLMPVEGSVARSVKFSTNDPTRQSVELYVHAIVHK